MTNVRFLTQTKDGRSITHYLRYNFSASEEAKIILKWLLNVDDFSLSYYDLPQNDFFIYKFKKAHVTSMHFRSIYSFCIKTCFKLQGRHYEAPRTSFLNAYI